MGQINVKCKTLFLKRFGVLRVNFHDVENMNPRPINAVERFLRASERFVVAAFFIICVSSDSLLSSSPVLVTSKKAISYKIYHHMEFEGSSQD